MPLANHPAAGVDVENVASLLRHGKSQVPVNQRPDVSHQSRGGLSEAPGRSQATFDLVFGQRHVDHSPVVTGEIAMDKSDRSAGRLNLDCQRQSLQTLRDTAQFPVWHVKQPNQGLSSQSMTR